MMDFDRIADSAPVNATAARQTGKGVEWTPAVKIQDWFADQPAMKPSAHYAEKMANPEWQDFRGQTFGRLTVLGIMAGRNPAKQSSWVCRCQCGNFCTRVSKSLKVAARGGNSFAPMCGRCNYQQRLRSGWTPNLKNQPKLKNGAAP